MEVDQGLRRSRQLDYASEGSELALARTCQRLRVVVVPGIGKPGVVMASSQETLTVTFPDGRE